MDDSDPTTSSTLYVVPFVLTNWGTSSSLVKVIKAKAFKGGTAPSGIDRAEFTLAPYSGALDTLNCSSCSNFQHGCVSYFRQPSPHSVMRVKSDDSPRKVLWVREEGSPRKYLP